MSARLRALSGAVGEWRGVTFLLSRRAMLKPGAAEKEGLPAEHCLVSLTSDPQVSSLHARVDVRLSEEAAIGCQVVVTDLNSLNGTFLWQGTAPETTDEASLRTLVNGEAWVRLAPRAEAVLAPPLLLRVGETLLQVLPPPPVPTAGHSDAPWLSYFEHAGGESVREQLRNLPAESLRLAATALARDAAAVGALLREVQAALMERKLAVPQAAAMLAEPLPIYPKDDATRTTLLHTSESTKPPAPLRGDGKKRRRAPVTSPASASASARASRSAALPAPAPVTQVSQKDEVSSKFLAAAAPVATAAVVISIDDDDNDDFVDVGQSLLPHVTDAGAKLSLPSNSPSAMLVKSSVEESNFGCSAASSKAIARTSSIEEGLAMAARRRATLADGDDVANCDSLGVNADTRGCRGKKLSRRGQKAAGALVLAAIEHCEAAAAGAGAVTFENSGNEHLNIGGVAQSKRRKNTGATASAAALSGVGKGECERAADAAALLAAPAADAPALRALFPLPPSFVTRESAVGQAVGTAASSDICDVGDSRPSLLWAVTTHRPLASQAPTAVTASTAGEFLEPPFSQSVFDAGIDVLRRPPMPPLPQLPPPPPAPSHAEEAAALETLPPSSAPLPPSSLPLVPSAPQLVPLTAPLAGSPPPNFDQLSLTDLNAALDGYGKRPASSRQAAVSALQVLWSIARPTFSPPGAALLSSPAKRALLRPPLRAEK